MNTHTTSTCAATITLVLPEGTSVRSACASPNENEWDITITAVGPTDDIAAQRIHRALDALAERFAP